MVPCTHTVVVCVVRGGGGLLNMGLLYVFSSCFIREIEPHSGSVYTHSGCMCRKGEGVGGAAKHGALKGVFQFFYKGSL